MKLLLLAGVMSLAMVGGIVGGSIARADDCDAKLTADERATFASLTPADQKALVTMKNKDGSPATCELRGGVLDMLGHYSADQRPTALHYLMRNTFVKQN
jgi:hypothetical protein